jgi:hypothetical protein
VKLPLQTSLLDRSEMDEKFDEFDKANPQVYRELVALAKQAKEAGRSKIGIKMLFEVVRWNRYIQTTDQDFKLNNNYHSRYARKIMHNEPELRGFFDTRELKTSWSYEELEPTNWWGREALR